MGSDNKQIKDGLGNLFGIRMHDMSSAGDGSMQQSWVRSSLVPLDYGGGGGFQHVAKSGLMAAGLAAASPVYSFRYEPASALMAALRRVKMLAWSVGAFTAGLAIFDLYAARNWTAGDGGGVGANLSGNGAKLRTSMGVAQAQIVVAGTAALVPGTRTLDAAPMGTITVGIGANANTPFIGPPPALLFEKPQGDQPLQFAINEGFVIRASVPATGTWSFAVISEWDELPVTTF